MKFRHKSIPLKLLLIDKLVVFLIVQYLYIIITETNHCIFITIFFNDKAGTYKILSNTLLKMPSPSLKVGYKRG